MLETNTAMKITAQDLMAEVLKIKASVKTLDRFARVIAAPQEGGESVLQRWQDVLGMLVDGQTKTLASLEVLHKTLLEPGIASSLKKIVEES